MNIFPNTETFVACYEKGEHQLVWARFSADLETPVSVALKFQDEPFCCLFESVEGGVNRARYSFITLRPDLLWKCEGGRPFISALPDLKDFKADGDDIFASLRKVIAESKIAIDPQLPPMAAGLFGFMGYDMVRYMEDLPDGNPDTIGIPEALYLRPQIVIVFDSVKDEMTVVTPVFTHQGDAKWALEEARTRISNVVEVLDQCEVKKHYTRSKKDQPLPEAHSNTTRHEYHEMVNKAKEYILAGDIFQVVPSQRFTMEFNYSPFSLYRELRRLNPSPFSFFVKMDDFSLVGSSPEILVRLQDGVVTVRPIAGTRKRGKNDVENKVLAEDLLSDPKELAEHLMLVDLGRNDVGRVAEVGSVKVTENMVVEHYSHVMHIVSNVQGRLRKDKDALDAMIAGFPVGTVSGAPKIRAMEIIDELEKEKRSFYAGGVGYFSANGQMDNCITLRTALVKDGKLYAQAGGGVVADSDPDAEYQESCNKARALLKAAEEVVKKG